VRHPQPAGRDLVLGYQWFDDFSNVVLKATWTVPAPTDGTPAPPPPPPPTDGTPAPPPPPTDGTPGALAGWQNEMLDAQNQKRANHCVPAFTWDETVAQSAQEWANRCVFEHAQGTGLGENLFGGGGTWTSTDATESWYSESADYVFANPGFSLDTGHFTQMVWKDSTKLGCGRTVCDGSQGTFVGMFYVCRYAPQGNITGAFPENVLPVCQ
jgi:uncharacterized protein YkwD